MNLTEFAKEVHVNAVTHGWWEVERSFPEIIALCHSELSEALEAYRRGMLPREIFYDFERCADHYKECAECRATKPNCHRAKMEGVPVELADCILRILDYCGRVGIDIEAVVKAKHEYNKTRPYKHGGKEI